MNIYLTARQQRLYRSVREYAATMPAGDAESASYAAGLVRWLAAGGVLDPLAAKNGFAVSSRALCATRHALAYHSALADTMFAMQGLGSYPLLMAGNERQKQRLRDVVQGKLVAAFALTEPEAGSDAASLRTTAVRDKKDYRITGEKSFISNAGIADYYILFAKTKRAMERKAVTAFLLDADTPGLTVRKQELLSPHPIGELVLAEARVPMANRLGAEGGGLRIALATLEVFRPTVGAAALGFAERALDEALAFTQRRRQFGKRLMEFQGTQFRLAEMAAQYAAAKELVYRAAYEIDGGAPDAALASSIAKMYATEAAQGVVDSALQLHGGRGVLKNSIMERLYRDVRALRIYEGTTEIQKIVVARELRKGSNNAL